jgi:glycosyltransferase involved in cell wall biosynthesis
MAERPWLYIYDGKLKGVGIDLVAEQQLRALSEAGVPCRLVSRGRVDLPAIRQHTWAFPPTKLLSWLPSQDYYAANKRFFSLLGRQYLRGGAYRGVIAWSKTALKAFELAAQQGIPRILNVGNFHCDHDAGGRPTPERWPRIGKERLRREYALASRILVASDYAAQTFVGQGVPAEKLSVIFRGVDTEVFKPARERPASPFIVVSCGSLGERKGTYELIRIWRKLALADSELWLIGTIPKSEDAALRQLADPSVRFFGFRRDLPDLMAQAHVHVLLSRNEGFAKVLLEAAACAVVNVCTEQTGLPPGAPGSIVIADRYDEAEVGAALSRLHADPARLLTLGEEARDWVVAGFTWHSFRGRFCAALADATLHPRP